MPDAAEWIIELRSGVTEGAGRKLIADLGGSVRRRMRADHPDQIILLARLPGAASARLAGDAAVLRLEPNRGGFRPMG